MMEASQPGVGRWRVRVSEGEYVLRDEDLTLTQPDGTKEALAGNVSTTSGVWNLVIRTGSDEDIIVAARRAGAWCECI